MLPLVVGDEQVQLAIPIHVGNCQSHPRLGRPLVIDIGPRLFRQIGKAIGSPIDEQEVRVEIVGHVQVNPPVLVEIDAQHALAPAAPTIDSRRRRMINPAPLPIVPQQSVRCGIDCRWPTECSHPAGPVSAVLIGLHAPGGIVRHVQVEQPIIVGVEKRRTGAPQRVIQQARLPAHILESSIPQVLEQPIGAETVHEDVGEPIVVKVADRHATAVGLQPQPRRLGVLAERPVPAVAVRPIAGPALDTRVECRPRPGREVEIDLAIQVKIPGGDPAAVRRGKRLLVEVSTLVDEINPALSRHVGKAKRPGPQVRGGSGGGTPWPPALLASPSSRSRRLASPIGRSIRAGVLVGR